MKCKVGIFFGERDGIAGSSLADGRNVFFALDRNLFEPVPYRVSAEGHLSEAETDFFTSGFSDPDPAPAGNTLSARQVADRLDLAILTLPIPELSQSLFEAEIPFIGLPPAYADQNGMLDLGDSAGYADIPFGCLVVRRDDQAAVALPPWQTDGSLLDGDSLLQVRRRCERELDTFEGVTLALFRGSHSPGGDIRLTGVQLLPSLGDDSEVFASLARIGLNPTQSLTFLLSSALQGAISRNPDSDSLRDQLQKLGNGLRQGQTRTETKLGVLMGGAGSSGQRSKAAGRHVLNLFAAMPGFNPVPLWLVSTRQGHYQVLQLPLSDLFQEELPGLTGKAGDESSFTALEIIRDACQSITQRYGSPGQAMVRKGLNEAALARTVEVAFLQCADPAARNGDLQQWLHDAGIPFTGPDASAVRINADQTLALKMLQHQGFPVPAFEVVRKGSFRRNAAHVLDDIEATLPYPILAAPASRGERALALRIRDREQLESYLRLGFGTTKDREEEARKTLNLPEHISFPKQDRLLLSDVPRADNPASHALLIGLMGPGGKQGYTVFPPREIHAPATGREPRILSRELSPALSRQASDLAAQAAAALEVRGLAIFEALALDDEAGQPMLELSGVQSMPLLQADHALFRLAQAGGFDPFALLEDQIGSALERPLPQPEVQKKPAPAAAEKSQAPESRERPPVSVPETEPEPKAAPSSYTGPEEDGPSTLGDRFRAMGRRSLAFLRSGFFLRNLAFMAGLIVILLVLTRVVLKVYTHHGEAVEVGEYVGKKLDEVERLAESKSFRTVVIDSVFMLDREPNVVIEQDPEAFAQVKKNRRIYLTITSSTAPMVQLPPLQGAYNYDQYQRKLLRLRLKPRVLDRRYDNRLEDNTILFLVYDGEEIREEDLSASGGIKVPVGSEVGFVVTERITEEVPVPDLVCKGYNEAVFLISSNGLSLGTVKGDVPDRRTAYVFEQVPAAGEMIEKGSLVDISLSLSPPAECDPGN